jgi:hypothetical protein
MGKKSKWLLICYYLPFMLPFKYSMLLVKNLIFKNYEFNAIVFVLQMQVGML